MAASKLVSCKPKSFRLMPPRSAMMAMTSVLDREVALMSENSLRQRTYLQLLRGKLSLLTTAIGRGG